MPGFFTLIGENRDILGPDGGDLGVGWRRPPSEQAVDFPELPLEVGIVTNKTISSPQNIVVDTGFDDAAYWTAGTGWTVSGSKANAVATFGKCSRGSASAIVAGNSYGYSFTVSGRTVGSVSAYVGSTPVLSPAASANGTYTGTFLATTSNEFGISSADGFTGSVDSLIITPAIGAAATAISVSLKTLDRTLTPVANLLSRINAMDFDLAVALATTIRRSVSKRITRTVAVAVTKSKQLAKRIKSKSGPRGTGTGTFPTFVGVGNIPMAAAAGQSSPSYPSGVANKDIGILAILWTRSVGQDDYPYANEPGNGWQRFLEFQPGGGNTSAVLWWKRLTGSESGTQSVSWTGGSTSLGWTSGSISAWRGCIEDDTPVEVQVGKPAANGNPQIGSTLGTLGPNRLIVTMFFNYLDNQLGTPDGSAAERWDQGSNSGNDGSISCYTLTAATSGPNGPISRTLSGAFSYIAATFALIPQPPGGGVVNNIDESVGVASLFKQQPKTYSRTLAISATIKRVTSHIINRAASGVATIQSTKAYQRVISRTVALVSTLDAVLDLGAIDQAIDAVVNTSATIRKQIGHAFARSVAIATSIRRTASHRLQTSMTPQAVLLRATIKLISWTVATSSRITRQTAKRLLVQSQPAASIRKLLSKSISIDTAPAPVIVAIRTFNHALDATANVTAAVRRAIAKTLNATANGVAMIERALSALRAFTATVSVSASVKRVTVNRLTALAEGRATVSKAISRTLNAIADTAASIALKFHGYLPSLRRIVAEAQRRLIIAAQEFQRRIIAPFQEREVTAAEEGRQMMVASAEQQRRIVAPADPREIEAGDENRQIVPPPDL